MHFGGDEGGIFVKFFIFFVCLEKGEKIFCISLLLMVLGTLSPILLAVMVSYYVISKRVLNVVSCNFCFMFVCLIFTYLVLVPQAHWVVS